MIVPRAPFIAAYLVVSGLCLMITNGVLLMPFLHWLKGRSDAELQLIVTFSAKLLIALGLSLLVLWTLRRARVRRKPVPPKTTE